ncbi:hypothetical protein TSAR_016550 [Trichomalopsis sarcophagae]|uniref:Transport and Golgi organization protein 2 n=1 Tax=Trichomalopsis sarcophagae TaxID=543379 RepID=A0A232F0N0_9HYME|nr:hypothetical protein TSAR_016550 [Trichomalopsis sarcophagae]
MCILFIYRNPNPTPGGYKLIIIANRDEYYARPADSAHFWKDYPGCLGGTDMEPGREGGTWLALNVKNARVGVLLNLNGVPKSIEGKGRGFLVRDYLTSTKSTIEFAKNLHKVNQETQLYNPYNLVMVELKNSDVYYLSSELNHQEPTILNQTILGCGNSGMEKPYKKVVSGKNKFEKIVNNASTAQKNDLIENLLQLLKHEEKYLPDDELQKRSPNAFNELSSIFVRHKKENYGTRTHSIVLVDDLNNLTFVEETLKANELWERQIFNNHLE